MTAPTLIESPAGVPPRPDRGGAVPPVAASPTPTAAAATDAADGCGADGTASAAPAPASTTGTVDAGVIPSPRTPVSPAHAEVWAIVERAQSGDRAAVAALYERYRGTVLRAIAARIRDQHIVEDIAADVWVNAIARIGQLRYQGQDPGAWFNRIARNLTFDYFKSAYFQRVRPAPFTAGVSSDHWAPEDEAVAKLPPVDDPADGVADYLLSVDVMRVIGELTADQRDVIMLRFVRDLNVEETARAMGKHPGAIKALQYRAVRSLARLLAPTP